MLNISPYKHTLSASRKYGNNRIIAYSPKLQRQVVLYSNLEYQFYLFLEFDKNIISFCEQPDLKISGNFNGEMRNSIADFFIQYSNETNTLVECKSKVELSDIKVTRQIHIQQEWAMNNGIKHMIITEDYFKNREFLLLNYKKLHTALLQVNNAISSDFIELSNFIIDYLFVDKEIELQQVLRNSPQRLNQRNILPIGF